MMNLINNFSVFYKYIYIFYSVFYKNTHNDFSGGLDSGIYGKIKGRLPVHVHTYMF